MEEAKNSAADKLEVESTLRMFEDREANASTESAKAYARAGRDLCRAALLVNASPAASLAHSDQTVVALLQNALQAYVRLGLPDAEESGVSAGVLLVPADANLEPRGTSYGGKTKYQWQTDAIHRGMSGKANVQLYLNR